MAAAHTLVHKYQDKIDVTVLEASNRAGGRIACEEIQGFHVHAGAGVFHRSFATVLSLADSLNVPMRLGSLSKGGHMYSDGKLWGIYAGGTLRQTLTTARTLLSFRVMSLRGMWQSFRCFMMLQARKDDLDFEDHSRMLDLDTEESFAELMQANGLTKYLEESGQLDISCFTAGYPEQVGAAYGMALVWLWTMNPHSRTCLPEKGIAEFTQALIQACDNNIRYSTPVARIVVEDGMVRGVNTADGVFIEADAVICATTASAALEIAPDLPPGMRNALSRVRYAPHCNVAIGLDENILPDGSHAAMFRRGSGSLFTMVTNLAALAPQAAPTGKTLVHASVISEQASELFALSDPEIESRIIEEMHKYFPNMPKKPLFTRIYRWPEALCLVPGGMLKAIYEMKQRRADNLTGLILAGEYMRMPSCNGAMVSGVEAADECAAFLSRTATHLDLGPGL